jgi:drug/metabolite transporter (DMT)-like permease
MATYMSNAFWLAGMRLTKASVASALNQLSTIFIFVMAALFLKEKATPRKVAAVVLAFLGALLVSVPF